jgi:hypothetical protein
MLEWKTDKDVKKAHEDLYELSNPNDPTSDTLFTVILKTVFTENECTTKNARWVQSVLETIFDIKHLSPKIDVDIIESWTKTLTDTEMEMELVNILVYVLVF